MVVYFKWEAKQRGIHQTWQQCQTSDICANIGVICVRPNIIQNVKVWRVYFATSGKCNVGYLTLSISAHHSALASVAFVCCCLMVCSHVNHDFCLFNEDAALSLLIPAQEACQADLIEHIHATNRL